MWGQKPHDCSNGFWIQTYTKIIKIQKDSFKSKECSIH